MFGQAGKRLRQEGGDRGSFILSQSEALNFAFDLVETASCTQVLPLVCGQQQSEVLEVQVKHQKKTYLLYRSRSQFKDLYSKLRKDKKVKKLVPKLRKADKKDHQAMLQVCNEFLLAVLKQEELKQQPTLIQFLKPNAEDSMDKLLVKVLAGKNLPAADTNGLSDPFCLLGLYNDQKKKISVEQRTPVIKETLNPNWGDSCQYAFVLGNEERGLTLSCRDFDRVSRNDFLGRINIPLDTIPYNQWEEWWFPLHRTKNHSKEGIVRGSIKLALYYRTSKRGGPCLDSTMFLSEEEKALQAEQRKEREERMKRKEKRSAGRVHLRYRYNPPNQQWEGYVEVTVVECKDLKAMDARGSSDPYVVLSVNQQPSQRTKTIKKNLNPVYDETFYFHLLPKSIAPNRIAINIEVYDRDTISGNDMIGENELVLTEEDFEQDNEKDEWVTICSPPKNPKKISKKLGSHMAEEGWVPKLPIVLVPGFGSSSLEVKEGWPKWKNTRVWLSIGKLTSEKMHTKFSSSSNEATKAADDAPEWEREKRNRWVLHMSLDENDGISDPAGVKLRPVKGTAALTYLDPGPITSNLSYVMGPLVENLQRLGYVDGENLMTAPYDWRVAPQFLEQRDRFYSNLKSRITDMVERNRSPVVVMGHSMGNRTLDYFFRFVKAQSGGQEWLDSHIHTWIAVGPPFLGAPKAFRGLASGDSFGMDAFLTQLEAIYFGRCISTTGFLFPVGLEEYYDEYLKSLVFMVGDDKNLQPLPFEEFLVKAGAQKSVDWFHDYYEKNPLFGGDKPENWAVLSPPPIKRLHAIYGVNLPTEKFYFYTKGKNVPYDIDESYNNPFPNHKVKDGYGYETKETQQKIIKDLTGHEGCRSGDGTVPYASLAYCQRWKKHLQVTFEELEGAEHRQILNNREFFKKLVEYIAEKPALGHVPSLPPLLANLIDDIGDL